MATFKIALAYIRSLKYKKSFKDYLKIYLL